MYSGIQQTGAGAGGTDRPDQVAQSHVSTGWTVREDYFGLGANNPTFFHIAINVPGGSGPNHGRFGTLGRDTFRGPGHKDFDFALIRDTPFGHRGNGELGTIEFRAELFNRFNLVNFGLPSNIVRGSRIWHHQQDRRHFTAESVLGQSHRLKTGIPTKGTEVGIPERGFIVSAFLVAS